MDAAGRGRTFLDGADQVAELDRRVAAAAARRAAALSRVAAPTTDLPTWARAPGSCSGTMHSLIGVPPESVTAPGALSSAVR